MVPIGETADLDLVEERQSWLLKQVEDKRRVMTNDAAKALGVSVDTIRRDLRLLHERGLLKRVHGGAIPVARLPASFAGRTDAESETGALLAARIVRRFRSGNVVGLDGGSTCVTIARMIPSTLAVMVVTNNPAAAIELADHPNASVILLGGQLDLTWMATTGADTVDSWRNYRLDLGVLGVCGLDGEIGLTTNSPNEVATKKALISASEEVVVPVQAEKVGVRAPLVVAQLGDVSTIVADVSLPAGLKKACRKAGTEIELAKGA